MTYFGLFGAPGLRARTTPHIEDLFILVSNPSRGTTRTTCTPKACTIAPRNMQKEPKGHHFVYFCWSPGIMFPNVGCLCGCGLLSPGASWPCRPPGSWMHPKSGFITWRRAGASIKTPSKGVTYIDSYICIYGYKYFSLHTYIHICICIHMYMYMYMYVFIEPFLQGY